MIDRPSRGVATLSWVAAVVACGPEPAPEAAPPSTTAPGAVVDTAPVDTAAPPPSFCEDGPRYRYAPSRDALFTTFPDDVWAVDDPSRATGRRLDVGTDTYPGLADFPANLVENFDHAATLDGFGRTTPAVMQFDADVSAAITADQVVLLADGRPHRFTLRFVDEGRSLFVEPLTPLPSGAEVIVGVFAGETGCIVPSEALRAQLTTEASPHAARVRDALRQTGRVADEVGALVVYTTHTAADVAVQAAALIETRDYALASAAACTAQSTHRSCLVDLPVDDLRGPDGVIPVGPVEVRGGYALPLRVWLPDAGTAPWPVVVCGHGLGGDKDQCDDLGRRAADEGVAVVAPDAIENGDHPINTDLGINQLNRISIFAIRVLPPGIHSLRLRDNFHQAAFEKLMLVRAIEQGMDVDGDGTVDLDATRMAYVGASLGGIMGVEPAALTDAFGAVALIVAGGQLTRIISDGEAFAQATSLLVPPEWTDGDLARAFPLLQQSMDGADPAVFAQHLVGDRLRDRHAPHVLLLLAQDDEVIPNSSSDVLARALGLPGLGTQLWPIDGITFGAGSVRGNLPSGATGAVVQLAEVHQGDRLVRAEHGNLHTSEEASALIRSLFVGVRDGTTPELVAP